MTRFHFERPDGPPNNNAQNILVHLNEFVPPQGYGGGQVLVPQDVMAYDSNEIDWFDEAWNERRSLTIEVGQIPSTQTNYTLTINSIISSLVGASAIELRFAKSDKIQLDYQIEKFVSATGELIAKVLLPTASVGDLVYVYSDNPLAVDEQSTGAWDVNYKAVYPLHGNGIDSTSNGQDLTIFGTTTVPAKIGDGISFAGAVGMLDDFMIRNPITGFPSTKITVEFWAQTTGVLDGLISYATASPSDANDFLLLDQNNMAIFINDAPRNVSLNINNGNFHHVVVTWDSVTGSLVVYRDKIIIHSSTGFRVGMTILDGGSLVLGQDQDNLGNAFGDGTQSYNGILNEVRISDIIRDADYVTTTFNNQDNPNAFYSIGVKETFTPVSVFGYDPLEAVEIPLTIIAGQIPSTQTNFEFLIDSTFPQFIGKVQSKFIFEKNGLPVPHTITEYNPITGKLRAWLLLPTTSNGDVIQIINDDSLPDVSTDDPTAVWSEYERVWYMDKVLGGVVDSTGKSANGFETGGVTPTPGLFGDALDFTGGTKFVTFPTLSIADKISISMWVNYPTLLPTGMITIVKNPINAQWSMFIEDPLIKWRLTSNLFDVTVNTPSINTWHLLTVTQDGVDVEFYVDAVLETSGTQNNPINNGTGSITMGIFEPMSFPYEGFIGHSTIQNEILTQDRITALFNNQINPETFYSVGTAAIFQFPVTDVMGYDV